jgi:DNA phosphorothioation-dependent restriction protein DptG
VIRKNVYDNITGELLDQDVEVLVKDKQVSIGFKSSFIKLYLYVFVANSLTLQIKDFLRSEAGGTIVQIFEPEPLISSHLLNAFISQIKERYA